MSDQDFKNIVKEGMLEVLRSDDGQGAIVDAMHSLGGQEAIKRGSLAALKSDEGQEIITDNFISNFHEIATPALDDIITTLNQVKSDLGRRLN